MSSETPGLFILYSGPVRAGAEELEDLPAIVSDEGGFHRRNFRERDDGNRLPNSRTSRSFYTNSQKPGGLRFHQLQGRERRFAAASLAVLIPNLRELNSPRFEWGVPGGAQEFGGVANTSGGRGSCGAFGIVEGGKVGRRRARPGSCAAAG